jgi:hypothetical protein
VFIGKIAVLLLIVGGVFAQQATFSPTNEITSNDMFGLSGHGDTLWMATNWGINYTIAKSETLSWSGYKSDQGRFNGALGFGSSTVIAALASQLSKRNGNVVFNDLWEFSHINRTYKVISTGFESADYIDSIEKSANFSVVDIAWAHGGFWCACMDGGLVRYDIASESMLAYLPGKKTGFTPSSITRAVPTGLKGFPDTSENSNQRVIAIDIIDAATDTPMIFVVTPARIWTFSPKDQAWDSLTPGFADKNMKFRNYQNVYTYGTRNSFVLYATIKFKKDASTTDTLGLFRFDTATHLWKVRLENLENAPPVSFGPSQEIYLSVVNQMYLYKDTNDEFVSRWNSDIFQKRMTLATGGEYPNFINDVLCIPAESGKTTLWLASSTNSLPTNNGLFYSLDEKRDELDTAAFHYVHRDKKINAGLTQSYAFPSILNSSNSGKAVFAYNLSKPSRVTIKIFDWNMDPVRTVIKDRDRPSGNDRSNGRSTNAAEDVWDGTTDSGHRVAVGVYYYKITAQSGEHSFGKIIVAK